MKPFHSLKMLGALLLLSLGLNAQSFQFDNNSSSLIVYGTSNIHDWIIDAAKSSGTITLATSDQKITGIENLEMVIRSESLKSGKSGMDKNTYKALKTEQFKTITYKLKSVKSINQSSNGSYHVMTSGILELAGVKKNTDLKFNLELQNNKVTINGEHELKMTDFNIEPPTAVFGSIKTGDEVKIKFRAQFNK
ncbi:YceI family protein [Christiangramia sp. SM2212]|uniref:YceI family protein n=1 Tax=Christiangramia sediminicola TaxID=3073267 RepID=A0ABU1EU54_9FLAO|nr:YceI family protein [Christiangramia sp. SM2212]MDR5591925.1 YceI family protein [Christiangramia sp. SM2212]